MARSLIFCPIGTHYLLLEDFMELSINIINFKVQDSLLIGMAESNKTKTRKV